jgi:oligopeptide transport system substrate-binding protein
MAIDKRVITDTVVRSGQIPTTTYIPPNSFKGYKTPAGLPYDIPRAQKLMAEAGYPRGAGFPHVHLLFNDDPPHAEVGETIRRQWRDALGIDVELESIEAVTFANRERNHDYAISRASWYGDYLDPSTFTDKYKPDSENNESGWINTQYADLCQKADIEIDPQKRLDYYAQAEALLLDEAPIIPIYVYTECYVMRKNVFGLPLNVRSMMVFSSVGVRH